MLLVLFLCMSLFLFLLVWSEWPQNVSAKNWKNIYLTIPPTHTYIWTYIQFCSQISWWVDVISVILWVETSECLILFIIKMVEVDLWQNKTTQRLITNKPKFQGGFPCHWWNLKRLNKWLASYPTLSRGKSFDNNLSIWMFSFIAHSESMADLKTLLQMLHKKSCIGNNPLSMKFASIKWLIF